MQKNEKAKELASSGCVSYVRHATTGAMVDDALNF